MKFIIDKEIDLNENDSLNSKSYCDTLKESIVDSPKSNSFTIGLFGEWGSGKSSIIETVKTDLETDESKKYHFVTYDAWKYANDSFRRMFLLEVQESLRFNKTSFMESFYSNRSSDVRIKRRFNYQIFLILSVIMIGGIITIILIPSDANNWKLTLPILISFIGIFTTISLKALDELKINIQKPLFFAPEQFEQCFIEMLTKSLKSYNKIQSALLWINGDDHVRDIDKLVIVIDNIDRCSNDLAYELLTDTKSFLSQPMNVVFLIPVDDRALKKHLIESKSDYQENHKDAEEFLRKFFSVTIRLKPLKPIELFEFADKINKKNELNFTPDTIDIVSNEYASNPRRIIQFFNNLITELHHFETNYDEGFVRENESLICKLLIIKEEWPDYYTALCKAPYIFNESSERNNKLIKSSTGLQVFLNDTKAISSNIEVSVFEKLLANGSSFDSFSSEILHEIKEQNTDSLAKRIKDNSDEGERVVSYIIEELRKGIARETYSTLALRALKLLIELDRKVPLKKSDNRRIQNQIEDHLDKVLLKLDSNTTFVNYLNNLLKQDISYIENFITDLINEQFTNVEKPPRKEVSSLIKALVMHSTSHNLIVNINDAFVVFYKTESQPIREIVSKKNIEPLVTNDLMGYVLSKLSNPGNDPEELSDVLFIVENSDILKTSSESIFERFNTIYPNINNRNKSFVLNMIYLISDLISDTKISKPYSQFQGLVTKLLSNRSVGGRNINIINEIISEDRDVERFCDFLRNVYNSTGSGINVSTYYLTLGQSSTANRKLVNNSILQLKNDFGYTLFPLYDVILSDETYEEESLKLLNHIFSAKNKVGYRLDPHKRQNKILKMTDLIFSDHENADSIIEFFESLTSVDPVRDVLSDIISGKTKEQMLRLSPTLLKLSFDKITQSDDLFNYQNDLEVLKAIAQSGEKIHLVKLSKVIVSKMLKEETYEDALTILENSREFNSRDTKNIVGHLESIAEDENYSERASTIMQRLNGK